MLFEDQFLSYNKRDQVQYWIYVPAAESKAVVQLIHGFGENARRYIHMISRFLDEGFVVACDDHVGHGKTAIVNNTWGDIGNAGPHTMMEDEHILYGIAAERFPGLPYFIFGHSMGSMIARDYVGKYGDELAGVIFCGTSGPALSAPGIPSEGSLTLSPEKMKLRFPEGTSRGNEWICDDPWVQKDHMEDPLNAFGRPFTPEFYALMKEVGEYINSPEWAKDVPVQLPIYNIAGDQDPVGQYGAGVIFLSNMLIDTGHNVKTKLYPGLRHEIHNYKAYRDEVESGIVDFIMENIPDKE